MAQDIRFRDADKVLRKNGYVHNRSKGSHHLYVKNGQSIVINNCTNMMVWQRLCKENKLNIN